MVPVNSHLPRGWELLTLGEIVDFKSGGTPRKSNEDFWNGDVPFVTAADLTSIAIDETLARSFLTEHGWKAGGTGHALPGAVLLGTRTRVGRVGVAKVRMAASQDVTILHCRSDVSPEWLARFLKSRNDTLNAAATGATIQGITRRFLAALEVPIPPFEEQQRIAAIMSKAEEARSAAAAQLSATNELAEVLLYRLMAPLD
ncbi:MAG: hypothetical protein F4X58_04675 [Chloroflexi bacterium]|nr:hypothetical protein [Chloroflexota bacterium]MYC01195.1 hypothetical protein [Chloroflexota bacterium]